MADVSSKKGKMYIAIIGTCDTKLDELLYLHEYITGLARHYDASPGSIVPILIDIGRAQASSDDSRVTVSISSFIPVGKQIKSRHDLIPTIGCALKAHLLHLAKNGMLHGALAVGGSCGSSIVAEALQALPIGFPKVLLSTMASGDVKPYIGCTDICVMYSVVDIAGLNTLLKGVLQNAAAAIVGMVLFKGLTAAIKEPLPRKKVAMTMFGITTPACNAARSVLEQNDCEVYVFHATGSGGMAMEKLILDNKFDGVIDLTTTELADEAFGGVLSAGSERLKGAAKMGIPAIISLGALDCINFGPRDTLPERYECRRIHVHNSAVTLIRTSIEDNRFLGEVICDRLKGNAVAGSEHRLSVWLPLKSVSSISEEGGVFRDGEADAALYGSIKMGLQGSKIPVVQKELDINDPQFAEGMAHALLEMMYADKNQEPEDR
ncbi:hypothetical protein DRE_00893 [Drechslerella stenobrocha 248]|uniref:Uncharacterized protein n=1 Tax=Drechslerella stenobrocha 248 TaxID=1043628 RepID=W7HQT3_9PEZI|nr:hypothetical protein DRE_00893 [Drechslerella stenobrocha 248]